MVKYKIPEAEAYRLGQRDGAYIVLRLLRENPHAFGVSVFPARAAELVMKRIEDIVGPVPPLYSLSGETPGQKSARKRRMERMIRDEELAREMAVHIKAGMTTKEAAAAMGKLGVVRSQRVRALAVKMGLLQPRE